MKVVYYPKPCPGKGPCSIAVGFFDGLHKGHAKIICHAIGRGKRNNAFSAVVTFQNHPINILEGKIIKPLLTPLAHKLELIRRWKPDICYVIPFTREFSKKSPEEFIRHVLIGKLRACKITVGFNFRFGYKREGDVPFLVRRGRSLGFKTYTVKPVMFLGKPVSSSRIRREIACGELNFARRMLGHPVTLMGTVIKGDGIGKKMGFPTANLRIDSPLVPAQGVYSVDVFLGAARYAGLMNIGPRPKFLKSSKPALVKVEIYLLNFKRNIYGRTLFIEIIRKCREEMVYCDPRELIRRIGKDVREAHAFFERRKNKICYVNI